MTKELRRGFIGFLAADCDCCSSVAELEVQAGIEAVAFAAVARFAVCQATFLTSPTTIGFIALITTCSHLIGTLRLPLDTAIRRIALVCRVGNRATSQHQENHMRCDQQPRLHPFHNAHRVIVAPGARESSALSRSVPRSTPVLPYRPNHAHSWRNRRTCAPILAPIGEPGGRGGAMSPRVDS